MGIWVRGLPLVPASRRRIFQLGFSERRFARTAPAEPEPTMMKSYSLSGRGYNLFFILYIYFFNLGLGKMA